MTFKGTGMKEFIINKLKFKTQLKIITSKYHLEIRIGLKFGINYKLVHKIVCNE